MRAFEVFYLCVEPFLPVVYQQTRWRLQAIIASYPGTPEILDVGGRKSHYTIGLRGNVTITDLPRETALQQELDLGITPQYMESTRNRRSNVKQILYDDMTRSALPDQAFDCVVAVEVLEHVEEDQLFAQNVSRVLKEGGTFLMTTPNGDHVKINNPDHKHLYTKDSLTALLRAHFDEVQVDYMVKSGYFHGQGSKSWSPRRPVQTLLIMMSNLINLLQSSRREVTTSAHRTHHLAARARKRSA
ncbi:MAG: class I SAM-dependent methyltransferase [Burkholderiales bacterium]|nr:class I SAM-dependent methyltransferase [Anaerolineae bacterium]